MADKAKRFSKRELAGLKKMGVLEFIARCLDVEEDDVKWIKTKEGKHKLQATYSIEGRNTIKAAIRDLSTKDYAAAVETGYVDVLAAALGHHDKAGKPSRKVFERLRGIESNNNNGAKTGASATQANSNGG